MAITYLGVTYLKMADSIDPNALPPGMDAYAGYDDGNWPDFNAIAASHQGSYLLELTVFLANRGRGLDLEPGDATPPSAPVYVNERHAAGISRPVLYGSISGYLASAYADLQAAGIPRSSYKLLSAHYGRGAHICGPSTCATGLGSQIFVDGTQWTDHADDGSNLGNWDESLLFGGPGGFFDAPTPVALPPVGTPTPSAPPAPTQPPPNPASLPILHYGSPDSLHVKYLQMLLLWNAGQHSIRVDGVFGSATLAAVRNVQTFFHLTVDGVVGPQTWRVLLREF